MILQSAENETSVVIPRLKDCIREQRKRTEANLTDLKAAKSELCEAREQLESIAKEKTKV